MNSNSILSQFEQQKLIQKLEIFKIQGRDKCGNTVLSIIGKHFPGKLVSAEAIKTYLEHEVFPRLGERLFAIVYVHTGVNKTENFPGISALKLINEAIPIKVRQNLESVYFLHPGLQSRLFLATFGRLLFISGLYWKVRYMNRLKYLWDNVRRKEIEIPEFVYEYEEQLECQYPTMEYGLESDHSRAYGAPVMDSSISTYSMRATDFRVRRRVRKSIGDRVGESEASSRSDQSTYSDFGEISKVEARRSSREENCDDSVEVIVGIIPTGRIRVEGAKDLPNLKLPCFRNSMKEHIKPSYL
ncbi:protein GDAP2-like protein [Forsythia ovata]|uniref:Protein GDAP2-like protein n=1 Tax=Forsythia ovata TaxID=205694 RepID=A0ABD1UBA3_9LAMI